MVLLGASFLVVMERDCRLETFSNHQDLHSIVVDRVRRTKARPTRKTGIRRLRRDA